MLEILILTSAAFMAGAVNSVAGGGTLLTFPSLLAAGVPSIVANATNTLALTPGSFSAFWNYRRRGHGSGTELLLFGIPSVIGGLIGAFALVRVSEAAFNRLVPLLVLAATALFVLQGPLQKWQDRRRGPLSSQSEERIQHPAIACLLQFGVAVYGGFFGAGIGIMMLASMGFTGLRDIHRMNLVKNFAAVCINGIAAITFIVEKKIEWPFALIMAVGAIAGGYLGAGVAQRIGARRVRWLVVAIGCSIGIYLLFQPLRAS